MNNENQPQPAQPLTQPQAPSSQTPLQVPAAQPQPVQLQPAAPQQQTPSPVQQTARTPAAQPQPQAARPAASPLKPGQKPVRKPPNPKKLIFGCVGCSGIALIFFILLVLIFVAQTTSAGENPMARALGVSTASLTNTLILLVNLIFGTISLLLFVLATIGIFRIFMARKDDKETRKKGLTMAGVSGLLLTVFASMWVGIYIFMTSKKVAENVQQVGIITEPASTLGLTAPISITFDGSKVPINTKKYDILSYVWDFGDGNTSTVPLTSNTYKDKGEKNGRFDVTLQVTKRDIATAEESIDTFATVVTIANVQLGAIFTATPQSGPAPLTVEFDAGDSSAPAGQIVSYEWDLNNDNIFTDGDGVNLTRTFEQLGTYTVQLRVTDNTGQFKISSKDITVSAENMPIPNIEIAGDNGKYYVGKQYTFQGGKSTSPGGSIQKYMWDFGDGSAKANTRTASHSYTGAGEYEVTLEVTDEADASAEATKKIKLEIPESAPIAVINTVPGPVGDESDVISGTVPLEVAFDASKSQDPDNNIVDYGWDFDGDGNEDAAGERANYTYNEAGIYNATLTVTDSENNESTAVMVVKAGSQPLQARVVADPIQGSVPLTVTFDAGSSSYPTGQIVSYEWDFGDGSPKRIDVSKVVYKYTTIGTFTASVTAIASDNTRSTAQIPVNVRPIPLTACFTAIPETGDAPLEIELDPKCSTGTITKYSWDFGDGESTKTRKPIHTFNAPGSYKVILEVSDNQNVIDSYSLDILVTGNI